MKKILLVALLSLGITHGLAQKMDREIKTSTFMPKGQWFAGGTISYTDISADDYMFLMIKDIKASAYTLNGKAMFAYTFANDVAAGLAFDYSRNQIQIDQTSINLSADMIFNIEDYYSIQHIYTATAFLRTYISLGNSKRFALFNDLRFNFGGGQGKIYNGAGLEQEGTYQKITKLGLTLSPGVSVFATNFMSVEASIGILGLNYQRTEQITNQVYQGSYESFSANFKINLLSIALGISFYF